MFCSSCGSQLSTDSAFCPNCGANNQPTSETSTTGASAGAGAAGATIFLKSTNGRLVSAIVGVALLGGAIFAFSGAGGPNLSSALSACGLSETAEGVTLGDGGKALFLDGEGEEDWSGMSYSDQICVLDELKVPEIVMKQMEKTSSLMGVQDAEWDGLSAKWTYHPDKGFELSITKG